MIDVWPLNKLMSRAVVNSEKKKKYEWLSLQKKYTDNINIQQQFNVYFLLGSMMVDVV